MTTSLMTDSQRRRQEFYQRLLRTDRGNRRYQDQLRLLAWTQPLDIGFEYPEGVTTTGAALVAVPVEIERTLPGTEVVIPSPFIMFEPAFHPDGNPPSPLYHKHSKEWIEYTGDIESWLRFQLPEPVVPLDLKQVELTTTVQGAINKLELIGRSDGKTVILREWENPLGVLRTTIGGSGIPDLDDRGGLLLGLRVHGTAVPLDSDSTELRQYWKVESLRLEASGRTRDHSADL